MVEVVFITALTVDDVRTLSSPSKSLLRMRQLREEEEEEEEGNPACMHDSMHDRLLQSSLF